MKRLRARSGVVAQRAFYLATGALIGAVAGALLVASPSSRSSRLRRKETPERADNGPIA